MAVLELPPEDGEHIGPYRIVRILGRGGMGEVFLAWDPRLNRSVAIKRIRHDSATTPILRRRLLNEAQAVGGLHHPAIVLIYDLLEDDGADCIVMEYVEGSSLAERLNDGGPLEPALAARLAEEIASGLAVAHGARIIHRDLKSENVMITPSGSAKILDFGLAKPIETTAGDSTLTAVGCVVGTCRSMSPEQARGARVDERSDLFSLGVVLYEMVTGISPFQGANALATLSKVISESPPCVDTLRPGLPPRLVALLFRLLAKDPDARPVSATEVARELHMIATSLNPIGSFDLEETVSDLPTGMTGRWESGPSHPAAAPQTAPEPEPTVRMSLPLPRRRTLEIAILSVLLMGIAGALRLHFHEQTQGRPGPPIRKPVHAAPLKVVHPLPPVGPQMPEASDKDLAIFRDIKQRLDAAETPLKPELRLDRIVEHSPRFLEARILAIDLAISLAQSTKEASYLEHAEKLIGDAKLPPDDPRLLPSRVNLLLEKRRISAARRDLNILKDHDPHNPQIPELQARLDESAGLRDRALTEWIQVADLGPPSWQNSLHVARLEQTFGRPYLKDAQRRLETLYLDRPENIYILQARAEMELYYGKPKKAKQIYTGLLSRHGSESTPTYLANLGAALVLLSEYDAAAITFNKIREINPADAATILNLADVEMARGHTADAEKLYQDAIEALPWEVGDKKETTAEREIRAQCLANTGKTQEAMKLAESMVGQSPNDATILQTAALVFAIAHDDKALDYIQRALDKGIQPRWFRLAAYQPLFGKPRFEQLVNGQ